MERYAYRSFDRQWIFADTRLGDFLRPDLWHVYSPQQVYLTSLLTMPLGKGPALTASAFIPDLHHFSGRGAKDVIPLYRSSDDTQPNFTSGVLDLLSRQYQRKVSPEEALAYVYAALAQPAFTERFAGHLETRELRVPITKDPELFESLRKLGAWLLFLHTFGERFVPEGKTHGQVPRGQAKCNEPIPSTPDGYPDSFDYNESTSELRLGKGLFSPVAIEVFEFEVSGLKVLQSWLRYRMRKGAGRQSSPLDRIRLDCWTSEMTTELLQLLWVLEQTLAIYPEQAKLLDAVIGGSCFIADDLPPVEDFMRKPPSRFTLPMVAESEPDYGDEDA